MDRPFILTVVAAIVASFLKVEEMDVVPETTFADFKADSDDMAAIVAQFALAFEIGIPDESAAGFRTVEDVISFVETISYDAKGKRV